MEFPAEPWVEISSSSVLCLMCWMLPRREEPLSGSSVLALLTGVKAPCSRRYWGVNGNNLHQLLPRCQQLLRMQGVGNEASVGLGIWSDIEVWALICTNALICTLAEFSLVLPLVPQQPQAIAWLFSLKIKPNWKPGPVVKGQECSKCQIFVRSQLVPGRDSCS